MRITFLLVGAIVLCRSLLGAQSTAPVCGSATSATLGRVILSASSSLLCDPMADYARWLEQSNSLLGLDSGDMGTFDGSEWDVAAGVLRLGRAGDIIIIRADSAHDSAHGGTLFLSLLAQTRNAPFEVVGTWFVRFSDDGGARRFRSGLRMESLREHRSDYARVLIAQNVVLDSNAIEAQLERTLALRRRLGIQGALPTVTIVVGPKSDSTLSILGILTALYPLRAVTVFPPLVVFGSISSQGALDEHELVHVATFDRSRFFSGWLGEAFALFRGGSAGEPFMRAFCQERGWRNVRRLSDAQVDSAASGWWWNDNRREIAGFVAAHALAWYVHARQDDAWIFKSTTEPPRDGLLSLLSQLSGIPRDSALREVTSSLEERRAACEISRELPA